MNLFPFTRRRASSSSGTIASKKVSGGGRPHSQGFVQRKERFEVLQLRTSHNQKRYLELNQRSKDLKIKKTVDAAITKTISADNITKLIRATTDPVRLVIVFESKKQPSWDFVFNTSDQCDKCVQLLLILQPHATIVQSKNMRRPVNWIPDEKVHQCMICHGTFNAITNRKHHCRSCGEVVCSSCSSETAVLPDFGIHDVVRVCQNCFNTMITTRVNPGIGLGFSKHHSTNNTSRRNMRLSQELLPPRMIETKSNNESNSKQHGQTPSIFALAARFDPREIQNRKTRESWKKYLGHNPEMNPDCEELKELIRKGIPPSLRGYIWQHVSNCNNRRKQTNIATPHYYSQILAYARQRKSSFSTLEKDLERTFPLHDVFKEALAVGMLRRILVAYGTRNPDVGYCQSMNFIGALLLLFMEERDAFWMLCSVVEDVCCVDTMYYHERDLTGVHIDECVFHDLAAEYLPDIFNHVQKLQFNLSTMTVEWFLCLFVTTLPLETTLRVWDIIFNEGVSMVFRAALAILMLRGETILKSRSMEHLIIALRGESQLLSDADLFVKTCFDPQFDGMEEKMLQFRQFHKTHVEQDIKKQYLQRNSRSKRSSIENETISGSPAEYTAFGATPPLPGSALLATPVFARELLNQNTFEVSSIEQIPKHDQKKRKSQSYDFVKPTKMMSSEDSSLSLHDSLDSNCAMNAPVTATSMKTNVEINRKKQNRPNKRRRTNSNDHSLSMGAATDLSDISKSTELDGRMIHLDPKFSERYRQFSQYFGRIEVNTNVITDHFAATNSNEIESPTSENTTTIRSAPISPLKTRLHRDSDDLSSTRVPASVGKTIGANESSNSQLLMQESSELTPTQNGETKSFGQPTYASNEEQSSSVSNLSRQLSASQSWIVTQSQSMTASQHTNNMGSSVAILSSQPQHSPTSQPKPVFSPNVVSLPTPSRDSPPAAALLSSKTMPFTLLPGSNTNSPSAQPISVDLEGTAAENLNNSLPLMLTEMSFSTTPKGNLAQRYASPPITGITQQSTKIQTVNTSRTLTYENTSTVTATVQSHSSAADTGANATANTDANTDGVTTETDKKQSRQNPSPLQQALQHPTRMFKRPWTVLGMSLGPSSSSSSMTDSPPGNATVVTGSGRSTPKKKVKNPAQFLGGCPMTASISDPCANQSQWQQQNSPAHPKSPQRRTQPHTAESFHIHQKYVSKKNIDESLTLDSGEALQLNEQMSQPMDSYLFVSSTDRPTAIRSRSLGSSPVRSPTKAPMLSHSYSDGHNNSSDSSGGESATVNHRQTKHKSSMTHRNPNQNITKKRWSGRQRSKVASSYKSALNGTVGVRRRQSKRKHLLAQRFGLDDSPVIVPSPTPKRPSDEEFVQIHTSLM